MHLLKHETSIFQTPSFCISIQQRGSSEGTHRISGHAQSCLAGHIPKSKRFQETTFMTGHTIIHTPGVNQAPTFCIRVHQQVSYKQIRMKIRLSHIGMDSSYGFETFCTHRIPATLLPHTNRAVQALSAPTYVRSPGGDTFLQHPTVQV